MNDHAGGQPMSGRVALVIGASKGIGAATAFDRRLRAGLSEGDAGQLEALLTRLRDNVSGG